MMRLDPADFQDPACTCAVGVLCQACSADLALLASHTDPLGQIAAELHHQTREETSS